MDAWQHLEAMQGERKFHPSLLRMQQDFLESYFELKEVDAAPNWQNLQRTAHTFWHISVNFKRRRVKELRRRLAEAAAEQRRLQHEEAISDGQMAADAPPQLLVGNASHDLTRLAQLEGDEEEELWSDGEDDDHAFTRSLLPARKPRRMQGIYRGSGVPRQKQHRLRRANERRILYNAGR